MGTKGELVERIEEETRGRRSRESKRDSSPSEGVEVNVRLGGVLVLLCWSKEDCSASVVLFDQFSLFFYASHLRWLE